MADGVGEVVLVRHGETEWSASRRHTGLTDVALTPRGEAQARALATALSGHRFALALASPLTRAARTAKLAGVDVRPERDLAEWDYGGYEGRTTAEIRAERPGWVLWRDGVTPGGSAHPGESIAQVGARCDQVLARARDALSGGDVVLFGHAHVLRILAARWLDLEPSAGRYLALDTATISLLGHEHGAAVIRRWNAAP